MFLQKKRPLALCPQQFVAFRPPGQNCSICLTPFEDLDSEVAAMPCKHLFHRSCISRSGSGFFLFADVFLFWTFWKLYYSRNFEQVSRCFQLIAVQKPLRAQDMEVFAYFLDQVKTLESRHSHGRLARPHTYERTTPGKLRWVLLVGGFSWITNHFPLQRLGW